MKEKSKQPAWQIKQYVFCSQNLLQPGILIEIYHSPCQKCLSREASGSTKFCQFQNGILLKPCLGCWQTSHEHKSSFWGLQLHQDIPSSVSAASRSLSVRGTNNTTWVMGFFWDWKSWNLWFHVLVKFTITKGFWKWQQKSISSKACLILG